MTDGTKAPAAPGLGRRLVCGALSAMLWLPLGIVLGLVRPWAGDSHCDLRMEEPVHLSPDGALAVQLRPEVCDAGLVFIELITRLEAWRVTAPETRYTLARWERAGLDDDVAVTWTGPGELSLSLTAWSGARLRAPPLAGLVLTVVQAAPLRDEPAEGNLRGRGADRSMRAR